MTAISVSRSNLWEVTSRTIVYAAIGAALYGILLVIQIPIPGTKDVSVRPAFAIVPFFGYAFGPIVGFFTGFVGNAIGDQISGWGALTSWNWSIANGLVGFIAGLAPLYLASMMTGTVGRKAIAGAIAGVVGVLIGFLFVFTDMFISGYDVNTVLTTEYLPVISTNLIATIILVPVLVLAWEPVKERLGR
jgi:energy-coupling factor transport system substrate-specific component